MSLIYINSTKNANKIVRYSEMVMYTKDYNPSHEFHMEILKIS